MSEHAPNHARKRSRAIYKAQGRREKNKTARKLRHEARCWYKTNKLMERAAAGKPVPQRSHGKRAVADTPITPQPVLDGKRSVLKATREVVTHLGFSRRHKGSTYSMVMLPPSNLGHRPRFEFINVNRLEK